MNFEIIFVLLALVGMIGALIWDGLRPGMVLLTVVVLFLCVGILTPKEMLENSDVPISEVCARSGFQSYAYFGRVFKQLNGMSPSEYRKAKRNTGISES